MVEEESPSIGQQLLLFVLSLLFLEFMAWIEKARPNHLVVYIPHPVPCASAA